MGKTFDNVVEEAFTAGWNAAEKGADFLESLEEHRRGNLPEIDE